MNRILDIEIYNMLIFLKVLILYDLWFNLSGGKCG